MFELTQQNAKTGDSTTTYIKKNFFGQLMEDKIYSGVAPNLS